MGEQHDGRKKIQENSRSGRYWFAFSEGRLKQTRSGCRRLRLGSRLEGTSSSSCSHPQRSVRRSEDPASRRSEALVSAKRRADEHSARSAETGRAQCHLDHPFGAPRWNDTVGTRSQEGRAGKMAARKLQVRSSFDLSMPMLKWVWSHRRTSTGSSSWSSRG